MKIVSVGVGHAYGSHLPTEETGILRAIPI